MKKILLLVKTIFIFGVVYAQQGVAINTDGANPDNSAMLDIKSTTKGLLIPRMTSVQRLSVPSPAKGLMVYDTDLNSFWYYNGSNWVSLTSAGGDPGWSLTGNSGTDTANNFLGTTDSKPLNIKTNNQTRLTILENGNVGINVSNPSAKLDVKSTSGTTNANLLLSTNNSLNIYGLSSAASNSGTGGAFGGNFTALASNNGSTAAGVMAYAQNGSTNYGFFGSVLTTGNQNGYGVYGSASGSLSTWGGYFEGGGVGVEAKSPGASSVGGKFTGGYVAVDGIGGQFGGRFSGTFKGIEADLTTTSNNGGWYEYGIDCEVNNAANTDNIIGINSTLKGNNASGNVIGIYSEAYGTGPFVTSYFGVGNVNITGSYYSSSDKKLKRNIKPLARMVDKIMQLSPSNYEYKTDEYKMGLPKGNQFGLIAQDVQKIFPELVAEQVKPASKNSKGELTSEEIKYLGINYQGFIPILIKGVQEQEEKIKTLQEENDQLKKDLAAIKAKLGL